MIRCIAVDDEAYATKIIADYVGKIPFLELVGTTTSAIKALDMVQREQIDLVFLDIHMPELTGMQFIKLCGGQCKIILITAYPQYALEGYEHDIIDYLLKPVAFDRFYKAVQKAALMIERLSLVDEFTSGGLNDIAKTPDFIFVKGDGKNNFLKIDHSDILYVEGLKNYVSIYTKSQRIVTYQTLRDLQTVLPHPAFYRVHKSYIVALDKIRLIDGNTLWIGEQAIPIGETYRVAFFKMIRE